MDSKVKRLGGTCIVVGLLLVLLSLQYGLPHCSQLFRNHLLQNLRLTIGVFVLLVLLETQACDLFLGDHNTAHRLPWDSRD